MTAPRVARLDLSGPDAAGAAADDAVHDDADDGAGGGAAEAGLVDLGDLGAGAPAERAAVAAFGDLPGARSGAVPAAVDGGAAHDSVVDDAAEDGAAGHEVAAGDAVVGGRGADAAAADDAEVGDAALDRAAVAGAADTVLDGVVDGDDSDGGSSGGGDSDGSDAAPVAALDDLSGTGAGPAAVADLGAATGGAVPEVRVARLVGGRQGRSGAAELVVQQEAGPRRRSSAPADQPGPRRRRSAERRRAVPADSAAAASASVDGATVDRAPADAGAPEEEPTRPGRARRPFGPKQVDPDADPVAAAREICLRLLTARARTRKELAQALARRGVPDEAAETVLERFDEVGLIDDAAFAGHWVRARHRGRGLARRAIAQELRRKGVDDETAGEALAEVDDGSEERRARELVDRKLRTMPADTPEQRTVAARKLVGMLARKGYGGGTAYGVVRQALADHGADTDELGEADVPD